jgi:predicted kinase
MKKIVMCKGLPASGKSTFAREFVKGKKDWVRVNNDELSDMLFGEVFASDRSDLIDSMRKQLIESALAKKLNIIVDNTNLHPKHEEYLTKLVETHNEASIYTKEPTLYGFEIKDFTHVPVQTCIQRNKNRVNPVPDKVIYSMHAQWIAKEPKVLVQDKTLPAAIIVDIDGTIANMKDRKPYNHALCYEDDPYNEVLELVHLYKASGHKLIFVTGREEYSRAPTERWLRDKARIDGDYLLYMRPDKDKTPDTEFKLDVFNKHIQGVFNVKLVLEDRSRMVEMYRTTIGLPCLQCAPGDF